MKVYNHSYLKYTTKTAVFIALFFVSFLAISQVEGPKEATEEAIPYYINLEKNHKDQFVYEINGQQLFLQYHCLEDLSKEMDLAIYNWKQEKVQTIQIDRQYGVNHYHLPLADLGVSWEYESIYRLEILEKNKTISSVLFSIPVPEETIEPVFQVISNPLKVSCLPGSEAVIEYYTDVQKGRGPFSVSWYVMDETHSKLLYQPTFQELADTESSAQITVDHPLAYYLIVLVRDICGNEQQQVIYTQCDEEAEPVVHSLFLEGLEQNFYQPTQLSK